MRLLLLNFLLIMNQQYTDRTSDSNDSIEPADPDPNKVDYSQRNKTRLALYPDCLTNAKPVVECGCGECHRAVDPLYEYSDNEVAKKLCALDLCESPRAMTVQNAKKAYITYQAALYHSNERTSACERQKNKIYPKILNSDRYFLNNFEGLTTVLFTRRIRPTDTSNKWIEPATLDAMLHNSYLMRRLREASRYRLGQLKGLNYEYVRITAPTESTATPHEHRYFYVEDPDNEVSLDDFRPIMDEHIKYCANAEKEDHSAVPGERDAINIEHNPPLVDEEYGLNGTRHTRGVQYLASQLAHLPLGDKLESNKEFPKETLLEGGAIGWTTRSHWFGSSSGVPSLNSERR